MSPRYDDPGFPPEEELLTVAETARRLYVDPSTVRRWIEDGRLEAIPLPSRGNRQGYRIRKSVVDNLLNPPR